jgi:hypothetical protein
MAEHWAGPVSQRLWESWQDWQAASLYQKWRKDNPGEDDQLRYYWNHEGAVPQLATATGKAYVGEAEGYWKACRAEELSYHSPLDVPGWLAKAIVAGPAEHTTKPNGNGWQAAYDFTCSEGTVIYAVEDGSCKHVYPDGIPEQGGMVPGLSQQFTMDGQSGNRWFYGHVRRPPDLPHRPLKGDPVGVTAAELFHFSGNNASELDRLVYST